MRTSENIKNRFTMTSQMKNESTFQILQYDNLKGSNNINSAIKINLMQKSSVRLKQIRIILEDSGVKLEAGALNYMKGDIEIINKTGGILGIGKKFFQSKATGESMFKPLFKGTGEILLEPSFGHFTLIELEDEEIIIDEGLFFACEESIEVEASIKKNASTIIFGHKDIFETKLRGTGIVVLNVPVPEEEILRCKMFRDILKVNGDLAILRSANIEFTVEKSGSNLIGSALNGEGLINAYRGSGEVWLVPTKKIYEDIEDTSIEESFEEDEYI